MPLHPEARALLDQIAAAGGPPVQTLPVEQVRQIFHDSLVGQWEREEVAKVEDRRLPGPDGDIPVRIYTPEGRGPFPVLVFFHASGWVVCDLETHDGPCRALANAVPAVVVSVDYRLAPEYPFPAAAEDSYAATAWVAENAATINGDPTRVAVGGDSAGGNLAAAVTLMAHDRGGPALAYQALICPVTDTALDTPSYRTYGEGHFITKDIMIWFRDLYLPNDADWQNPYAAPMKAHDLHGLPPALVITAECDPLRDEGEAYAARLREAGVDVRSTRYDGMIHGFVNRPPVFDQAKQAIEEVAAALRSMR